MIKLTFATFQQTPLLGSGDLFIAAQGLIYMPHFLLLSHQQLQSLDFPHSQEGVQLKEEAFAVLTTVEVVSVGLTLLNTACPVVSLGSINT